MNSLMKKLRLKRFIAMNTLRYSSDYLEQFYNIYLNHKKVIHFRDGRPVYSLSTPSLYSKPMANFMARQTYRTIQNKNTPNVLSFAINDECDAACEHCSFYQGVNDKSKKVMSLEQCKKLIQDSQKLGVSIINFVGGEPLLREDFPEIIRSVDKELSTTIMFTNGSHLTERAQDLRDAGLDGVYISIDSAEAITHDAFRRKEGLFDLAMKGIDAALSTGMSVGISFTITPASYKSGELPRMMELAKKVGVHEVIIFDAMPSGRYKKRKDLIDNPEWTDEVIEQVGKYNDDESYPGVLVWAYVTSYRSVGCSCGTSYFYASPYGDIMSCDFNHHIFGSILKEPLWKIWDTMTSSKNFNEAKWGGCKIKSSEFLEKKEISGCSGCAGCK
jgi:MoaA/NifB/PqqE/SkfB family radical SAM enzyme